MYPIGCFPKQHGRILYFRIGQFSSFRPFFSCKFTEKCYNLQKCRQPESTSYEEARDGSSGFSEGDRRACADGRDRRAARKCGRRGTAASGGYWVASAADQIIADSSTLTGSIGVFSLALGAHDLLNHVGVYQDGVATHEFADASIANPLSENTKETMRLSVEHTYDTFINLVAKSRRLSPANYISYAEGQVFLGDEAQNLGLIDDLGSLNDALNTAAKLIDSTLDDVSVLHLAPHGEKSISPLELFIMNKAEGIIPNELLKGFIDLAVKSHEGSENNAQYIALSPIKAEL